MSSRVCFPNSARAAWLRLNQKPASSTKVVVEVREKRLLAGELARDLREATLEQLEAVAKVFGRGPEWINLVRMEARRPGLVGRACLRARR